MNKIMNTFYFYPHHFPFVGDIVFVKITDIQDTQVYCELLEYNNIEGMLSISDVEKYQIKKDLRVGKQEFLEVIAVDDVKGYIDLSRKNLDETSILNCKNRYIAAKRTIGFFRKWSEKLAVDLLPIPLSYYSTSVNDVYYSLYESSDWKYRISEDSREKLYTEYNKLYLVKPMKYEILFELISYDKNGAELISNALIKAVSKECENEITCVGTSKCGKVGSIYSMSIVSRDPRDSKYLNNAIDCIKNELDYTQFFLEIYSL